MTANTRNGITLSLALLTVVLVSAMPWQARAGDSINIRVPVPPMPPIPKITLRVPPPMVWLPIPQVYVARDTPHHIFCHENRYYLFYENYWYVGPGYEGPWAVVRVDFLPPGLRSYRARDWDEYQHEAERRHRDDDNDHGHFAFYGHSHEHGNYERARWADWKRDSGDRERYNRKDRGEDHDHGHGYGRGHRDRD